MVIKDLLTGNTATGGGNLNVGAIGASLYTPLQLTGTGNVTSLRLSYWRNGVNTGIGGYIQVYENMILDLSVMAAAAESLLKSTVTTTNTYDYVSVSYTEGSTAYTIALYVIHCPARYAKFATSTSLQNLSDYSDGYFERPDFAISGSSPLVGNYYTQRVWYGQRAASQYIGYRNEGASGTPTNVAQGYGWNLANLSNIEFRVNGNGGTWGYARYKRRYPYCPDRTKRVTLKWLNSYGLYDWLHVYAYQIQPVVQSYYYGGARVTSYTITLAIPITDENNTAILSLCRSADIQGVCPIDINQWARVTVTNPTAYLVQGGALGKSVNLKCKFELIEA
jgi:hypothetical protein